MGIKRAEIVEKISDGHPLGQFLIFGDIADGGEGLATDFAGWSAQDRGATGRGTKDVHQDLDDGGLPCSVGSDEGIDGPLRNVQAEAAESRGFAKSPGEVGGLN